MKRIFFICLCCFTAVFLLASCKPKETYTPVFTLADGYTLEGERITATLIGNPSLRVRDFILSSDAITVYSDSTGSSYVQGLDADIPLKLGENRLILSFSNGTLKKDYNLDITCVSIESFSVTVKDPGKTYHIGEAFDKNTIAVIAVTEDGTEFEVKHYTPQYEFTALGESIVEIELDGFYESISVQVTEEYRPSLDENGSADGVYYQLWNGEAVLVSAEGKEGFFAVPSVVMKDGAEYSVTQIAPRAFASSWITGVMIADSVRVIGEDAFSGCAALEWVEMPEALDSLGSFAFYNCESLVSVEIPNGVKALNHSVFRNCKALSYVSLSPSLEVIGKQAFEGCKSLSDIRFPKQLHTVEEAAFRFCEKLSTVVVENLRVLGNEAFSNCFGILFFAAGDVEALGTDVFDGVKNATVYAREGSAVWKQAEAKGLKTVAVSENEYCIASLPVEFPIEESYPYDQTKIFFLSGGRMEMLSDYTVEYPKDACGYLSATIRKDSFAHTFTIFISYTEDIALDTDSRGVLYALNSITGQATLVRAPEWVRSSKIYQPEKEGLFLVPTTLWRDGVMYVVVYVEEDAFDETKNVDELFIPVLVKES
ncbi:MAG: leucine-rich repeat protein [Clostridia bacterium]|nr:leucine-rich repeat protein [Clostridia bacterium]